MMWGQLLAAFGWPLLSQPMAIPAQQCGVVQPIHILVPQYQTSAPLTMLSRWSEHELADYANCFSVHPYSMSDLHCEVVGERGRAQCALPASQTGVNAAKQVWFVPDDVGIAYNDGTRITLPLGASLQLVAHELAHWYGFADEYTMPIELARKFCTGQYHFNSLNVVVTDTDVVKTAELIELLQQLPWRFAVPDWQRLATPIGDDSWHLGSEAGAEIGLFATQTCAQTQYYSWRPVSDLTPMHYHDITVWPSLYLQLLERSIIQRF